jgi:hypothetical protein
VISNVAAVARAGLAGSPVGYDAYAVDLVIRTSRARVDAMAAIVARLA